MRSAAALVQILGLRDMRGRLVFPRLLVIVALHTAARATRRSFAFLVSSPAQKVSEFFRTLHKHRENSEIAFAGGHLVIGFVQATALLLAAIALLVLAVSRL